MRDRFDSEREREGVGSETASPNIKARKESNAEVEIVNSLNQATSPLEVVEFTYEEFADALSKYDFSFEIGDTISTPDMLSYMSFCQRTMFDSGVEFLPHSSLEWAYKSQEERSLCAYVCFCLLLSGQGARMLSSRLRTVLFVGQFVVFTKASVYGCLIVPMILRK